MTIRFLHSADWQLGRPFKRFPNELAVRLRDARLTVIERLAEHARRMGAVHVLVAGDVWDQETPAEATLRQPLDLMAAASDLGWWLLPGNHDPARANGLWDRLARGGLPANVLALTSPEPVALAPDTWLLPAPWTTKSPVGDPTAAFDQMPTPAGAVRIGLAHGSVHDFTPTREATAVIAADRAQRSGLAYLALGDWHGCREVGERTWYAGTPEPDRFPDNEPGYALAVELAGGGAAPRVQRLPTARFRWQRVRIPHLPGVAPPSLEALLGAAAVPASRTLLDVAVSGTIGLAERAALEVAIETWRSRLAHLDVDTAALVPILDDGDLDALGADGALRATAASLAARADREPAARRALDLLYAWAQEP